MCVWGGGGPWIDLYLCAALECFWVSLTVIFLLSLYVWVCVLGIFVCGYEWFKFTNSSFLFFVYMHTHVYVCLCIYIYIYICVCVCVFVCFQLDAFVGEYVWHKVYLKGIQWFYSNPLFISVVGYPIWWRVGCNMSGYLSIQNEVAFFPNSWEILLYRFVTSN